VYFVLKLDSENDLSPSNFENVAAICFSYIYYTRFTMRQNIINFFLPETSWAEENESHFKEVRSQ
jgi:hypothetical protein